MTTVYKQFTDAYDAGKFTPATKLGVKLVYQDYVPDVSHTLTDLKGVVLTAANALTWAEFQANGMSWIMDTLKDKAAAYREKYPDRVVEGTSIEDVRFYVVYSGGLKLLIFSEEVQ
jgi:hypothetical protein